MGFGDGDSVSVVRLSNCLRYDQKYFHVYLNVSLIYEMTTKLWLYPDDWNSVALAIKEANNWCCAECHKQCRRPGEVWDGWVNTLTVAHYYGDYDAPAAFCVALCAPCHLAHDAPYAWLSRRRHERFRRHIAGQLTLALQAL